MNKCVYVTYLTTWISQLDHSFFPYSQPCEDNFRSARQISKCGESATFTVGGYFQHESARLFDAVTRQLWEHEGVFAPPHKHHKINLDGTAADTMYRRVSTTAIPHLWTTMTECSPVRIVSAYSRGDQLALLRCSAAGLRPAIIGPQLPLYSAPLLAPARSVPVAAVAAAPAPKSPAPAAAALQLCREMRSSTVAYLARAAETPSPDPAPISVRKPRKLAPPRVRRVFLVGPAHRSAFAFRKLSPASCLRDGVHPLFAPLLAQIAVLIRTQPAYARAVAKQKALKRPLTSLHSKNGVRITTGLARASNNPKSSSNRLIRVTEGKRARQSRRYTPAAAGESATAAVAATPKRRRSKPLSAAAAAAAASLVPAALPTVDTVLPPAAPTAPTPTASVSSLSTSPTAPTAPVASPTYSATSATAPSAPGAKRTTSTASPATSPATLATKKHASSASPSTAAPSAPVAKKLTTASASTTTAAPCAPSQSAAPSSELTSPSASKKRASSAILSAATTPHSCLPLSYYKRHAVALPAAAATFSSSSSSAGSCSRSSSGASPATLSTSTAAPTHQPATILAPVAAAPSSRVLFVQGKRFVMRFPAP